MTLPVPRTRKVATPHCPICGRWNDPTGGPEAHSGGCDNEGQPYPRVHEWLCSEGPGLVKDPSHACSGCDDDELEAGPIGSSTVHA